MNREGYKDPTAERAIKEYNRMPHRQREALCALEGIASLLGFDIIVVRDKRTGRRYGGDSVGN